MATATADSKYVNTFAQHVGLMDGLLARSYDEQDADRAAQAICTARRRVGDTLDKIDEQAQRMIEQLTQVQRQVREAKAQSRNTCPVNSLGELQGRGNAFDTECARLDERLEALAAIERAYGIDG